MSLKNKYLESKTLADDFKGNNQFNFSTNRYYYFIYQRVLHISTYKFSYVYNGQKDSHKNLMQFLQQELNKRNQKLPKDKWREGLKITSLIGEDVRSLKGLRVIADYEPDNITQKECECAANLASKIEKHCNFIERNY